MKGIPIYDFVRVRDRSTGHEYDLRSSAVDENAHELLTGYPVNTTGQARPAKHRTTKAGQSTATKEK